MGGEGEHRRHTRPYEKHLECFVLCTTTCTKSGTKVNILDA